MEQYNADLSSVPGAETEHHQLENPSHNQTMSELPLPESHGGYESSRFNAVRHGVLSAHTVLPWEDKAEYESLLRALVEEHKPLGPTEEHLIEEIAGVIWRKRRLRLAEAASYRRGLEHATIPIAGARRGARL